MNAAPRVLMYQWKVHYINELDLILVTDVTRVYFKASFGHDGVIRVLLCEFPLMLQNYKEARFLSKK